LQLRRLGSSLYLGGTLFLTTAQERLITFVNDLLTVADVLQRLSLDLLDYFSAEVLYCEVLFVYLVVRICLCSLLISFPEQQRFVIITMALSSDRVLTTELEMTWRGPPKNY